MVEAVVVYGLAILAAEGGAFCLESRAFDGGFCLQDFFCIRERIVTILHLRARFHLVLFPMLSFTAG
jgi:hypothetical protein